MYTRFLVLLDTTFYPCNFSNSILSEQSFPQRGAGADRQQFSGRLFCLSSAARFGGKGDFFMQNPISEQARAAALAQLDAAEAAR